MHQGLRIWGWVFQGLGLQGLVWGSEVWDSLFSILLLQMLRQGPRLDGSEIWVQKRFKYFLDPKSM